MSLNDLSLTKSSVPNKKSKQAKTSAVSKPGWHESGTITI